MRANAHVDGSGSGQWFSNRAMSRNHWCCHWRPRRALSPSHGQFWIFHFSEFSTSCPNSHLVAMLYQFIITFPCSDFVHTFAPRKHVIRGVVFTDFFHVCVHVFAIICVSIFMYLQCFCVVVFDLSFLFHFPAGPHKKKNMYLFGKKVKHATQLRN